MERDELVKKVARALCAKADEMYDIRFAYQAAPDYASAIIPIVAEACAELGRYQAIISGCKKRRTKNLGLPREAYFTEIASEVAAAIRQTYGSKP